MSRELREFDLAPNIDRRLSQIENLSRYLFFPSYTHSTGSKPGSDVAISDSSSRDQQCGEERMNISTFLDPIGLGHMVSPELQRGDLGNRDQLLDLNQSLLAEGPPETVRGVTLEPCAWHRFKSVLMLNTYFDVKKWDEEAIMQRGAHLFGLACQVWPHPKPRGTE